MGSTRVASAIGLAMLMALSTIGAPATAQEAAADPRQPSPENPHMHIYGNDDLSNCFSHFDGNDTSGSAPDGYGEKEWPNANGQQIEMDYTCRMESFKQDMYLSPNGTIQITLNFRIEADGDCGAGSKCENLNLTLFKGGFQVARQEFPAIDRAGNDETVIWNIDVDKNMTRFNRSEEPQIQVEFSYPGYDGGVLCSFGFYCGGYFRMYYHTPGNDSAEVNFPVVNQSMPGEGGDGEEPGLIGGVTDSLPGFGLMAGVGSLAMAAVAASRLSREE
jgi:hypothetical protein